jgi:hypothetical protein
VSCWGLIPGRCKIYLFSSVHWPCGSPTLLSNEHQGRFPFVAKRPEHETDLPHPPIAEVRNVGVVRAASNVFIIRCLIN